MSRLTHVAGWLSFFADTGLDACTAAILLDVDPVGMVRGRGGKGGAEDQYVNDRREFETSGVTGGFGRSVE